MVEAAGTMRTQGCTQDVKAIGHTVLSIQTNRSSFSLLSILKEYLNGRHGLYHIVFDINDSEIFKWE